MTFLLCAPAIAVAQDTPDPASEARMHFGAVALTPSLSTQIGVDTNVFNEPTDPKQDVLGAFRPRVDAWVRLGPAQVSGGSSIDLLYFNQYTTERSINTANTVRITVPVNRLRPHVGFSYLNSRERLNAEVDNRARRTERAIGGGVDVRVGGRTVIGLAAQRSEFAFDDDSELTQELLRDVLNRRSTTLSLSVRQPITPLTTFVVSTQVQRARFEFSPERNSESVDVMPGLEFSTFALLNGKAYVGISRIVPEGAGIPSHTGLAASVDLAYTLLGATRFQVQASRGVQYSVEVVSPYYVQTSVMGSVTHRVGERWDVVGRVGRHRLAYQTIEGVILTPSGSQATAMGPANPSATGDPTRALDERTDTLLTLGTGAGYRVGPDTRIGLQIDYDRRRSIFDGRTYDAVRVGSVITYAF